MNRTGWFCIVWALLFFYPTFLNGNENDDKTESQDDQVFTPTSDWQPLRRDQAIPRGLHVRMNLQTGKREAKLLNPHEDKESSNSHQITEIKTKRHEFSHSEIKHALHKIVDGFESTSETEDVDRVKKQFRSYSDLKKELGEMKLDMQTDQEIIVQLISEYKELVDKRSGGNAERKELEAEENLLSQIEILVHQIDNAVEFVKLGGVKEVVFPSLNSSSWRVRYEATKVLGAAVQSNPKAKIMALESDAVQVLLRVLALDSHSKVKAGAHYALSCLIRRFPLAQKQFLDSGGLTVIVKQFNFDTSGQLSIQLKAINLIRDIIDEAREAEADFQGVAQSAGEHSIMVERKRQYEDLNLWARLVEEGWCQALTTLLSRHSEDVEVLELLSEGMSVVSSECYTVFKGSEGTISELIDRYQNINESSEYDYQWIYSNLRNLMKTLHALRKDEL